MNEHERVIAIGDAAMVKRESARRTRRSFLVGGAAAVAGYTAAQMINNSAAVGRLQVGLRNVIDFNAAVSRAVFRERGLSPEFSLKHATPLRMNGVIGMQQELVPGSWRLQVTGVREAQHSPFFSPDVTAWEYRYTSGELKDTAPDLKGGGKASPKGDDGLVHVEGASSQGVSASGQIQGKDSAEVAAKTSDLVAKFEAMAGQISGKRHMGTAEAGASASSLNIGTPGLLLTIEELRKLPRVNLITEFKCIEGWSQVTQWGGVRLRDFIDAFPPAPVNGRLTRYVYMETTDGDYYCGYDMQAARHPQSTLVMEMSGQPIPAEHGAPLRLHMPIKYGYKQIKRIGLIAYTDVKPDDFWMKLGYDWYAGL